MRYSLSESACQDLAISSKKEYLLTNGLGGFAMGTAAGINTRRYHGLLVAATNPPAGRHVLLSNLEMFVSSPSQTEVGLSTNPYVGATYPEGYQHLVEFSVGDSARWMYQTGDIQLSRELKLIQGSNIATIEFTNLGKCVVSLMLKPLVSHKFYHSNFHENGSYPQKLLFQNDRTIIEHESVPLILDHKGAMRTPLQGWYYRFEHAQEAARGLDARDDLYCPCELTYRLAPGESCLFTAGTSDSARGRGVPPFGESSGDLRSRLVQAVERFIVETPSRTSIIAGYPWFTDWGRDTMISLPGILLHTGRVGEARKLLVDYAASIQDGLIPNRFGEAGGADYNTVDATLWFMNAAYLTLQAEWELAFAHVMMDSFEEIYEAHVQGTLFGIQVDPADGLLTQGEEGLQLTWMDAKIGDWVVTPRHGKPVEINGLWINALAAMVWLAGRLDRDCSACSESLALAEANFEAKFWHEGRGHFADTVDPLDLSLRPNQVIALSLPFTRIADGRALRALSAVRENLKTPVGLRTLAPSEPGYCGSFSGKLDELDAAYHRGTVWPWLTGPYVAALLKYGCDRREAEEMVASAEQMLEHRGLGGIAEVYDGDPPHSPGGCPWQAWSVAEYLRGYDLLQSDNL